MSIAILLPCHNEGPAIGKVVRDFRTALPEATVYVYDNNSTDNTAEEARKAGAVVRSEPVKGKGNVVRRMFADIEADIYLMADGDGTYDASDAPKIVQKLIDENLDMVVGTRLAVEGQAAYRAGHEWGNKVLTGTVIYIFGRGLTDILSGYRAFSRRFVKSFPALSRGFETETEITVHALSLNIPTGEVETSYYERAPGTASKLNTYADGIRILNLIALLFKDVKPILFFSVIAAVLFFIGACFGVLVLEEFHHTGMVAGMARAVLTAGLMIMALVSFVCGIVLDSVGRGRLEQKRLAYLALPPLSHKKLRERA
ncbi:MAG TPA: glycosyltransferase [Patescibacteria group bacterium]|nr:glycosyltransferase [Patescibacteria group bacterium]